jgi:manganese transport system substrate-binding protein
MGFWAIALGLWLGGCGTSNSTAGNPNTEVSAITAQANSPADQPDDKVVVLTTFTVLADMAQNVAGEAAIVESITKTGAEIHGYEPTPSDLERGQNADLILDNGLNLERWAEGFYNNLPDVPHITLSTGFEPIDIAADAYQGKPNPHAWMSPQNALIYVDNIRQALAELDPENAAIYGANAAAYQQKIAEIGAQLQEAIATVPANQRYLVSCEGAFSYLARDYGLKEVYIWPVNAEKQATPKQMEQVIKTVRTQQIPAIFCESTVSNAPQLQVAKETGATFGGVFYVDSLSEADGPAATYLDLLEHNVTTLITGLGGGEE